jgi:hypothetical protein
MGRLRAAAATVIATFAFAATAGATSTSVFLNVTPSVVHRGQVVVIHGSAGTCSAGNTVFIISRAFRSTHEFAGVPAVLAKVTAEGRFQATARTFRRAHARHFVVTARCGGGNLGVSAVLILLP